MSEIDIVIIIGIILAVHLALRHIHVNRKKGCSGCCAECDRVCPFSQKK